MWARGLVNVGKREGLACSVGVGMHQGSVLGLLLFSIGCSSLTVNRHVDC